jgi:hypothetical protein
MIFKENKFVSIYKRWNVINMVSKKRVFYENHFKENEFNSIILLHIEYFSLIHLHVLFRGYEQEI